MAGFYDVDYIGNEQNFCFSTGVAAISWPGLTDNRPGVRAVLEARSLGAKERQSWLELEPSATLLETEIALAQQPDIALICVVQAGRLEGLVSLDTFYQRLTLHLAPAQLAGLSDQPYMTLAPTPTLVEVMSAPISLRLNDDAGRAYLLMQKYRLSALPVLDATGQVSACLELKHLAHFWAQRTI